MERGDLVTFGNGERGTVLRATSPTSVTLRQRRWWHRYRILRWAFLR